LSSDSFWKSILPCDILSEIFIKDSKTNYNLIDQNLNKENNVLERNKSEQAPRFHIQTTAPSLSEKHIKPLSQTDILVFKKLKKEKQTFLEEVKRLCLSKNFKAMGERLISNSSFTLKVKFIENIVYKITDPSILLGIIQELLFNPKLRPYLEMIDPPFLDFLFRWKADEIDRETLSLFAEEIDNFKNGRNVKSNSSKLLFKKIFN